MIDDRQQQHGSSSQPAIKTHTLKDLRTIFAEKQSQWPDGSQEAKAWWWGKQCIASKRQRGRSEVEISQFMIRAINTVWLMWSWMERHCTPEQVVNLKSIYTEMQQLIQTTSHR